MSSQGSNSVRIYSGTTFAPMSGNPLSKEVSTPSASSTEVISRPVDRMVVEPVRETTSISGRFSEKEEEDEVVVSCDDL